MYKDFGWVYFLKKEKKTELTGDYIYGPRVNEWGALSNKSGVQHLSSCVFSIGSFIPSVIPEIRDKLIAHTSERTAEPPTTGWWSSVPYSRIFRKFNLTRVHSYLLLSLAAGVSKEDWSRVRNTPDLYCTSRSLRLYVRSLGGVFGTFLSLFERDGD